MKNIVVFLLFMFFSTSTFSSETSFHDFSVESIEGKEVKLSSYKDKVVLLVNTASMCGFTRQYTGLQELYDEYKDKGLVVLGIPSNGFMQEHSSEDKVKDFCETNFNITFPMTKIEEVIGSEKHPLYRWLKKEHGIKPKWNFHKILIDKEGKVVNSYSSLTKPKSEKLIKVIEEKIKG